MKHIKDEKFVDEYVDSILKALNAKFNDNAFILDLRKVDDNSSIANFEIYASNKIKKDELKKIIEDVANENDVKLKATQLVDLGDEGAEGYDDYNIQFIIPAVNKSKSKKIGLNNYSGEKEYETCESCGEKFPQDKIKHTSEGTLCKTCIREMKREGTTVDVYDYNSVNETYLRLENLPSDARRDMLKSDNKKATLLGIENQIEDIINAAEPWLREEARRQGDKVIRDLKRGFKIEDEIKDKLIQSGSKKALQKNIATEIKAGKDPKQAVAIAYSIKEQNDSQFPNLDAAIKELNAPEEIEGDTFDSAFNFTYRIEDGNLYIYDSNEYYTDTYKDEAYWRAVDAAEEFGFKAPKYDEMEDDIMPKIEEALKKDGILTEDNYVDWYDEVTMYIPLPKEKTNDAIDKLAEELGKDYRDIELEDDDSPFGGIAYLGETLGDFIDETGETFNTLKELNEALKESGIKTLESTVEDACSKTKDADPDVVGFVEAVKKEIPAEEIDSHESDLYVKVSPKSTELLKKFGMWGNPLLTTFIDEIDHKKWYEIPFALIDKQETFDSADEWKEVKSKEVVDMDGSLTDYTWYTNGEKHIFMFGDKDLYEADEDYADWEVEIYEGMEKEAQKEAEDWFDNYKGFDETEGE